MVFSVRGRLISVIQFKYEILGVIYLTSYKKIESYQVEDIPPLGYRVLGEWIDDVHHIKLDITFDFATQSIADARAWAEKAPFAICNQGFDAVRQLIGTRVGSGFGRLVRQTLESPQGCLHVGELVLGSVKAALQASSRSVPEWAWRAAIPTAAILASSSIIPTPAVRMRCRWRAG
jgi:hypothetical protein